MLAFCLDALFQRWGPRERVELVKIEGDELRRLVAAQRGVSHETSCLNRAPKN